MSEIIIKHIGAIPGRELKDDEGIKNIRYDDTIDTIKQKIIIGHHLNVSIDSIYLFTKIKKNLSDEKVFKELTKSRGKFNTLDNKDINVLKQNCGDNKILNKKKFNYEDFKREFSGNDKKYNYPLGHSIFYKTDYAFVTNPYELIISGSNRYNEKLTWDTFLFDQDNNNNLIKYSGKKLLFEYLNPDKENTIFYCTAKEIGHNIFDQNNHKIERPNDFYKYILQIYFPKLFYIKKYYTYEHNDNIINPEKLIIKDIRKEWEKNHKKIDNFYEYFENEKNKEKRKEGLITSINLTIHMIKNVKIPMDLIFKILSCIEGMPMVKFNPGKGRENIFRLWTKGYLSKNGLKLPYLYVNDDNRQYKIKNIDKILALNKSVGIYIIVEKIELYCELYPDGSINIKIENINMEKEKLERFIKDQINEYILVPINDFVKKSGFSYPTFGSLTDDNIEIKNIKYHYFFKGFLKREDFKMSDFNDAINQIYQTYKSNFKTKGKVEFYYKKVSSYKKAKAKEAYIINYMNEYGQGVEVDKDLAKLLVNNKLVDNKEEAIEEIRKSKENLALNLTVYSSKKIEIRDSPGFKVTLSKDLKNTMIEYENINHYNYLSHIDVYTTYLYNNFLNRKKKEVKKLLAEKFYGEGKKIKLNKNLTNEQDPVNPDEQIVAQKEADDDDDDDMNNKKDYQGYDDGSDEEESSSDEEETDDDLKEPDEQEGGAESSSESSDSEPDEEEENIYGNLENVRVRGANNYFINRIKKAEPYLYAKRGKKTFSFATSCPSNYGRTPVLVTDDELKHIDELDAQGTDNEKIKSRSYDEHITTDNNNHYICPRFWCLSDKKAPNGRSLSFQQVNDGECGGWGAIIGENEKPSNEKRIFEFTDKKYHEQIKGNHFAYRPHYPGWSRKKVPTTDGKGEENICIPCCYNMPRREYNPKGWENEFKDDDTKKKGLKYWKTAPQSFQKIGNEIPGIGIDLDGITSYNRVVTEGLKKFRRERKIPKKNNMRAKEFEYCDGKKQGTNKDTIGKTIEFMSIPIIETFPLKYPGQLGYLPLNVQRLFNYNIVERVFKKKIIKNGKETIIKNSKLPSKKWVFVRLGMVKNDILSNIGNVYNHYMITDKNTKVHENIGSITSKLAKGDYTSALIRIYRWLEFFYLGAVDYKGKKREQKKIFDAKNPKDIQKYINKIKNNKKLKDKFVSMNKGNLYQMFKTKTGKVEDAIVNFIKFIDNDGARDTKAHEIFWDIITTPISEGGAFFDKGINLIILKRPKEDIVDKIDIVCPNNNFFKTAYHKDRPTVILYTENNIYEPIYMIKKPKVRTDEGWLIVKMFLKPHFEFPENSSNLSRFKDVITKVIKNIDGKCEKVKGMKKAKGYIFEENKTLNKWLDADEQGEYKKQNDNYLIKGRQVIGQLYNEDYQVITAVVKTNDAKIFFLPCAPSSIFPGIMKYRYEVVVTNKNKLLDYETTTEFIKTFGLTLEEESKRDFIARYDKKSMIMGIRTNTNQIIPIKPRLIEDPEKDVVDELIEWKIDKKILEKYPEEDEERQEIMKKIKLESNFYSMYRNLFKILINKADQKQNKKKITGILNDVTKSYWEKINVVQEEIKLIDDYITWTKFDINVFPDDLINCLGLDDVNCKEPSCIKNADTCQFIIPEYNLLYEEDDEKKPNKDLYKIRLTDEIVRYQKIREYILKNDVFLNFDNVEYKINDDEIVIISKMFFQLYINNIDQVYKSDNITNYKIYDNVNVKKYGKRKLKLIFEDNESGYDTSTEGVSVEETDYDNEDDIDGVVEEKEEKPKAKKIKAKKTKAKKDENKWSENEIKFVAFYLFYNFLMSRKINDLTIEKFIQEYKIIDLLVKKREEYAKKPSLGVIIGSLINEWSNSKFKEIRLDKKKQETDWEKNYKKKYRDDFKWPLVQFKYAIDRFMQVIWVKKPKTVGEALDVFYKEVIMQNNKPGKPGPQAIAKLATYEKKD